MARRYISINSLISARSRDHDLILTPSTARDLASFALWLLIEELGTEQARLFLREQFSKYRPDYRGTQRDDRTAERDENEPMTGPAPTYGQPMPRRK